MIMKNKKVFILGDIGLDEKGGFHFGDEAMFYANLKWYADHHFEVYASSRSISHSNGLFTESRDIYIKGFIHYYLLLFSAYLHTTFTANIFPKYFKQTLKNLIACDRLHISGGGNINEVWHGHVLYRALLINIANMYDIPIFVSGQTIGIFKNIFLKKIVSSALRSVTIIGIRDKNISFKNLLHLKINKSSIHFCPDDTLLLETKVINKTKEAQIKIGLSLHEFENENLHKDILVNLVKELTKSIGNISFILIPHYYSKEEEHGDDLRYMRSMMDEAKINDYISSSYSELIENKDFKTQVETMYNKYSELDIVISSRYHGIVLAFAHSVPVIGINLNAYCAQKNSTLYQEIGLDQNMFLHDISSLDVRNIVKNFAHIVSHREMYVNKIQTQFNRLKETTKKFYNETNHL